LRFITRAGLLIAAAAAVPYVIKKCKPLAEKLGDELVKAGENLKKGAPEPAKASAEGASQTKAPPKAAPKKARAKRQTKRAAPKKPPAV
jgi:hypothetical protein